MRITGSSQFDDTETCFFRPAETAARSRLDQWMFLLRHPLGTQFH
jgi:hypothetical protein